MHHQPQDQVNNISTEIEDLVIITQIAHVKLTTVEEIHMTNLLL